MSRTVPIQNLRGSDPTLLEVQIQPLLSRPLGQVAFVNMLDLLALSEHEDRPRSLASGLARYVERTSQSVADLPNGQSWDEFLAELSGIDAARIPRTFRDILAREAERDDRDSGPILEFLERIGEVEPRPFELGQAKTKVTRAVQPEPSSSRGSRRSRSSTSSSSSSTRTTRSTAVVTEDDRERQSWIAETCLERLATASENGLKEMVLVAGIRHRARDLYPKLTPLEVTTVLKSLKDSGRVRYSAGRWSAAGRW